MVSRVHVIGDPLSKQLCVQLDLRARLELLTGIQSPNRGLPAPAPPYGEEGPGQSLQRG